MVDTDARTPAEAAPAAPTPAEPTPAEPTPAAPTPEQAAAVIEAALDEMEVGFDRVSELHFAVELPGTRRLKTVCHLKISPHSLQVSAFVLRRPDENFEELWTYLLTKNARSYTVSWAIDKVGDVYLMGRLPLIAVTPGEIDRLLGTVLQNADDHFNPMIEIGFRTAILREWDWRIKRGESTANLEAFRAFIEREKLAEGGSASGLPVDEDADADSPD